MNSYRKFLGLFLSTIFTLQCSIANKISESKEGRLMGYVKVKSIPAISEKLMKTFKSIQADPSIDMLAFMVLAPFGYPDYEGIAKDENATLFFFDDEAKGCTSYIVVTKLTKEGALKEQFSSLGLTVEKVGSYSLISNDAALSKRLKQKQLLIEFNKEKCITDVKFKLYFEPLDNDFSSILKDLSSSSIKPLTPLISTCIGEIKSAKTFSLGINFDDKQLLVSSLLKAREGTELHHLFSQKINNVCIKGSDLLDCTDCKQGSGCCRLDAKAFKRYTDHLFRSLITSYQALENSADSNIKDFHSILQTLQSHCNKAIGEKVENVTWIWGSNAEGESIIIDSSKPSSKEVLDLYKYVAKEFIPSFNKQLKGMEIEINANVSEKIAQFKGIPIHKMEWRFHQQKQKPYEKISYFSTSNDFFISAPDQKNLENILEKIPSSSKSLKLEKNVFWEARYNIPQCILASIKKTLPKEESKSLENLKIDNTQQSLTRGSMKNGTLKMECNIPHDSLSAIIKLLSAIPKQIPEAEPTADPTQKTIEPDKKK